MNRTHKSITCLIALSLLTLTSCLQKTTSNRSSTDSNNQANTGGNNNSGNNYNGNNPGTGSGSGGYGDGNEPGVSDAGQTVDYYTLSNISVKGRANPAPPNPNPFWSSLNNFPAADRHIFATDSRFNLRVLARSAPSQGSMSVDGTSCNFQALPYQKLQIDVCVRATSGTCNVSNTHTFSDVPINQASRVKRFLVPQGTPDPLVVEIKDVQWDYTCTYYGTPGSGTSGSEYCPFAPVWPNDCVKFDFQFATDTTKDIPGTTY